MTPEQYGSIDENPNRRLASDIIEEFCELLELKGIKIPSEDREGDESEAPIFGTEYYMLEDKITDMLSGEQGNTTTKIYLKE